MSSHESVQARDVRAGWTLHNPYGPARATFTAAADPRPVAGGEVEIPTADGRAARFRAGFWLTVVSR